ncbi:MAG: hypothetical protein QXP36_04400 [Conexivisphaerales archaeon]
MCEIFNSRRAFVNKTVEMLQKTKNEALLMGRHIAWIEQEPAFASAVKQCRDRNVIIKVLSVKPQTAEKYSEAFEKLGCIVRFYDHGDIRVLIFDHNYALLGIPSETTYGFPHVNREYVAIGFSEEEVVKQLAGRFEEMWDVSERRKKELDESNNSASQDYIEQVLINCRYIVHPGAKIHSEEPFTYIAERNNKKVLIDVERSRIKKAQAIRFINKVHNAKNIDGSIKYAILISKGGWDEEVNQMFSEENKNKNSRVLGIWSHYVQFFLKENLEENFINGLL